MACDAKHKEEGKIMRKSAVVNINKDRFIIRDQKYSHQYFELYNARYEELMPRVRAQAKKRWNSRGAKFMNNFTSLEPGELSCVFGTVYVINANKPRALDEVQEDDWPLNETKKCKLALSTDKVVLEDMTGRISLIDVQKNYKCMVTGLVVGVLGTQESSGDFNVQDICFANEDITQNEIINSTESILSSSSDNKLIAIVSGINVESTKQTHNFNSFIDFINGSCGVECMQNIAERIVRVVIAGNTLFEKKKTFKLFKSTSRYDRNNDAVNDRLDDMFLADKLLFGLGKTINVDIIPGQTDPSLPIFPQQPLNPCIFTESSKLGTINYHTNPASFSVDNVSILGTSGSNVDDIYKYSLIENRLDIACLNLVSSHISPTAPDTLWCYSFSGKDKLVLESWPNIYFIGNQPKFDYKLIRRNDTSTLVLSIPSFSRTNTVILVDLVTLQPFTMSFTNFTATELLKKRKEPFDDL